MCKDKEGLVVACTYCERSDKCPRTKGNKQIKNRGVSLFIGADLQAIKKNIASNFSQKKNIYYNETLNSL